jgi:hypothetical protein
VIVTRRHPTFDELRRDVIAALFVLGVVSVGAVIVMAVLK